MKFVVVVEFISDDVYFLIDTIFIKFSEPNSARTSCFEKPT